MNLGQAVTLVVKWSNENQGVVSVLIWGATLLLGWATGIFAGLRRRPKFKMALIQGPTLCCTFQLGREHKGQDPQRTAIALYLHISNVGTASSSIHNVSVAYRRASDVGRRSNRWVLLKHETVALQDFQADIGGDLKVFPSLTQASYLLRGNAETFLEAGRSTNGVVYFEQSDSWGDFRPSVVDGAASVRVFIADAFGRVHAADFKVPAVTLEEAQKYNPSFGATLSKTTAKSP